MPFTPGERAQILRDINAPVPDWIDKPASEWPLDAPQPSARTIPGIELAVASPPAPDGVIILSLTVSGRIEKLTIRRHVAASMIAELARALANSP